MSDISPDDIDAWRKNVAAEELRSLIVDELEVASEHEDEEATAIEASSLDGDLATNAGLLGIDYCDDDEHLWQEPLNMPDISFSDAARSVLKTMHSSELFERDSSSRVNMSLINIVLFELFEANRTAIVEKNMRLKSNYPIVTKLHGGGVVTGSADYVLGCEEECEEEFGLITPCYNNSVVIIQARQSSEEHRGLTQSLAFMLGLQQKRLQFDPDCPTVTIYGMLSDGTRWQFLRLEGEKLLISAPFEIMCSGHQRTILNFMNSIIKASAADMP